MQDIPGTDSSHWRPLYGPSRYFAGYGVTARLPAACADRAAGWPAAVEAHRSTFGWPTGPVVVERDDACCWLAFEAPAAELSRAAWLAAAAWRDCGDAASDGAANSRFEPAPELSATAGDLAGLLDAARLRGLPSVLDDVQLSIGLGAGSACWPRNRLPLADAVDWSTLHAVPTALIAGSAGTVEATAAMLRAHGWRVGHATDGPEVDPRQAADTARTLLRQPHDALLLRLHDGWAHAIGIPLHPTAVFAIEAADDGAATLGWLLRVLDRDGVQVLPVDAALDRLVDRDALCAYHGGDAADPRLHRHRSAGHATCAPGNGELWLEHAPERWSLGAVSEADTARARTLATAALVAHALGASVDAIRNVVAA